MIALLKKHSAFAFVWSIVLIWIAMGLSFYSGTVETDTPSQCSDMIEGVYTNCESELDELQPYFGELHIPHQGTGLVYAAHVAAILFPPAFCTNPSMMLNYVVNDFMGTGCHMLYIGTLPTATNCRKKFMPANKDFS